MTANLVKLIDSYEELAPGQTRCIESKSGRRILLARGSGLDFFCIDAHCFHQGAQLDSIEDLGLGQPAALCPAHGRAIALANGREITKGWDGSLNIGQEQVAHPLRISRE